MPCTRTHKLSQKQSDCTTLMVYYSDYITAILCPSAAVASLFWVETQREACHMYSEVLQCYTTITGPNITAAAVMLSSVCRTLGPCLLHQLGPSWPSGRRRGTVRDRGHLVYLHTSELCCQPVHKYMSKNICLKNCKKLFNISLKIYLCQINIGVKKIFES